MRKSAVMGRLTFSAVVFCLSSTGASAQGARDTARSQSESGLTLSAEAFCSPTKLRTSSVRLRWRLTPGARSAAQLGTLATAKQTLDTTVYANGFEKGLYVSLPVPSGSVVKPVPAAAPAAAAQAARLRQAPIRAFQIRLVAAGVPAATAVAAPDSDDFTAVVEDLEPGVNYTWRLTIEGPSGSLRSAPLEVQAVTCPADIREGPAPTKKVPPTGVPPRRRR